LASWRVRVGHGRAEVARAFARRSLITGQFNHGWWETGGLNWYPAETRNVFDSTSHSGNADRAPVSGVFVYHTAGPRGTVIGISSAVFF
jgi:hypothetical protein